MRPPDLHVTKLTSVRLCQWADHLIRSTVPPIAYLAATDRHLRDGRAKLNEPVICHRNATHNFERFAVLQRDVVRSCVINLWDVQSAIQVAGVSENTFSAAQMYIFEVIPS